MYSQSTREDLNEISRGSRSGHPQHSADTGPRRGAGEKLVLRYRSDPRGFVGIAWSRSRPRSLGTGRGRPTISFASQSQYTEGLSSSAPRPHGERSAEGRVRGTAVKHFSRRVNTDQNHLLFQGFSTPAGQAGRGRGLQFSSWQAHGQTNERTGSAHTCEGRETAVLPHLLTTPELLPDAPKTDRF
jgi:hypothetical protein